MKTREQGMTAVGYPRLLGCIGAALELNELAFDERMKIGLIEVD
ncbi:hypothetical protein [Paraburkholderia rhizosphaerae]|nr:hypothetical protein [Paraburkholderia rhizosphaerae]